MAGDSAQCVKAESTQAPVSRRRARPSPGRRSGVRRARPRSRAARSSRTVVPTRNRPTNAVRRLRRAVVEPSGSAAASTRRRRSRARSSETTGAASTWKCTTTSEPSRLAQAHVSRERAGSPACPGASAASSRCSGRTPNDCARRVHEAARARRPRPRRTRAAVAARPRREAGRRHVARPCPRRSSSRAADEPRHEEVGRGV